MLSVIIVFIEQNSDWIYKTFKRKECIRHVDDEKNPGLWVYSVASWCNVILLRYLYEKGRRHHWHKLLKNRFFALAFGRCSLLQLGWSGLCYVNLWWFIHLCVGAVVVVLRISMASWQLFKKKMKKLRWQVMLLRTLQTTVSLRMNLRQMKRSSLSRFKVGVKVNVCTVLQITAVIWNLVEGICNNLITLVING